MPMVVCYSNYCNHLQSRVAWALLLWLAASIDFVDSLNVRAYWWTMMMMVVFCGDYQRQQQRRQPAVVAAALVANNEFWTNSIVDHIVNRSLTYQPSNTCAIGMLCMRYDFSCLSCIRHYFCIPISMINCCTNARKMTEMKEIRTFILKHLWWKDRLFTWENKNETLHFINDQSYSISTIFPRSTIWSAFVWNVDSLGWKSRPKIQKIARLRSLTNTIE